MPEVELHHDGHPRYRRMVRFDWSDTPLHWVPDDPFATHMMNVLHLLLPEGERHFIKAVLEASSLVDDPELEAAIKPFIQQESWHAWAHQVVLDRLAEQGIDTKPYTIGCAKRCRCHWAIRQILPAGIEALVAVPAPGRCGGAGTLHRDVGPMGAAESRSGLCGHRPDDAGSAALARRRRGRASLTGVRRLPARLRQLFHQGVFHVDDDAAVRRVVDRRSAIPDGPGPDHRPEVALARLAAGGPGVQVAGSVELMVTRPRQVHARPAIIRAPKRSRRWQSTTSRSRRAAKAARERAQISREGQRFDEGFGGSRYLRRERRLHEHVPRGVRRTRRRAAPAPGAAARRVTRTVEGRRSVLPHPGDRREGLARCPRIVN